MSGRGGTTPCWAKAMAVASTGPDPDRQVALALDLAQQHDRLVGGHLDADAHDVELRMRQPTPSARSRRRTAGRSTPQLGSPSPDLTSAACSRTDSAASSRIASSARCCAVRVALPRQRRHDLLDEPDLAVGRHLERRAGAAARCRRPPSRRPCGRWRAPRRRSDSPASGQPGRTTRAGRAAPRRDRWPRAARRGESRSSDASPGERLRARASRRRPRGASGPAAGHRRMAGGSSPRSIASRCSRITLQRQVVVALAGRT